MEINFGKHITNLLKEHECVAIPEIGALLLKQKAARISDGQLFPSTKTIHFNKNISTNDNLITSALIENEDLSFISAKLELNKFVSDIKFDLTQKGFFDIDSLGRFKLNEGNLSFVSTTQIQNLDKNNFGFNSLSVFEVPREIISDKKEVLKVEKKTIIVKQEIEKPIINRTRKIRKKSLVGLAAVFMLMFTIGSLMLTNTSFDNLKVQNANVLNFLVPSTSQIDTKIGTLKRNETNVNIIDARTMVRNEFQQETAKLKGENSENVEASSELKTFTDHLKEENTIVEIKKEEAIKTEVVKNYPDILSVKSENPEGYYVIIGAFSNLANANKVKYQCSIENACSIFKTESGMYRVGIYTTINKDIAIDIITEYKETNSSYWLMESK